MYVQKEYTRQLGVKRYKQKMDSTGSTFMEGLITIHELVIAKDNHGFSPATHTHNYMHPKQHANVFNH
jgi:hypothetical protein